MFILLETKFLVSINSASGEALELPSREQEPEENEEFPLIPLRVKH